MVIGRARLDQSSCACRKLVNAHFQDVLKGIYPDYPAAG